MAVYLSLFAGAGQQFFTNAGVPLAGGKIYTYGAGGSTPQATYTTSAGNIAHSNPIVLDAAGRVPAGGEIWLTNNLAYKFVLQTSANVTVQTLDNVGGGVDGASLAASSGSSLVGFIQAGAGAVQRTAQSKMRDIVSVKDFGAVGDGVVDDTIAIQTAINYLSNSDSRTLYFPAGVYKFSRVYCVYDATNNPGYNINRNAEIILQGDGIRPETGPNSGTVLNSTITLGDAFIVSNFADDVMPYRSREFELRDITIKANTTGYAVVVAGVVIPRFNNTNIINDHINGSGIYISTSFFATIEKTSIKNNGVGVKTGDAIRFNTNLFAGLFTMRDCNINGFANGLYKGTGSWQNISIYDSEIAATVYPIYIGNGRLDLLNIQGCYFEGSCTSFIVVFPEFGINNLCVNASWFYSIGLTGVAINLTKPKSVNISNCYMFDQYNSFLYIDGITPGYNGGGHVVNSCTFDYSVNPVAPVTYFTGILPILMGIEYPESVANCLLTSSSARPIFARNNYASSNFISASHIFETQTQNYGAVAGGSIDLGGSLPIPSFTISYNITSPTTHYLPPISIDLVHGYAITITNNLNSTQTFPVKTAIADGATTIANLAPGDQRRFVFFNDGITTGWY